MYKPIDLYIYICAYVYYSINELSTINADLENHGTYNYTEI